MTSTEHIKLSDYIKSIHRKLREEANILGTEQAWKKHCDDTENLEKYALAMEELAVNHWDKHSEKDERVISRVFWVYKASKDYFTNISRYRDKEFNIINKCFMASEITGPLIPTINQENNVEIKYRLLDVGSCYNPFQQFEMFKVVPIDIAPANKEVLRCDFLNLQICNRTIIEDQTVIQLEADNFDVIVFSLLLEYFPNPEQRLKCCINAYKLLKLEGILAIVTPDSNHVGSNAKVFKSWRYVLAKHGFIRVKYEKLPHIQCMLFRKATLKIVAEKWAQDHESDDLFQEMFIPQDFPKKKNKNVTVENVGIRDEWNSSTFLKELDCCLSE